MKPRADVNFSTILAALCLFMAPLILTLTPRPALAQVVVAINSAGPAVSNSGGGDASYVADEDFSGGTASSFTAAVNTSNVTNPAPQAVYLTQRYGNFTYTIPGLTAGASYTVRLHFAEGYWDAAGKRVFDVSINGTQVLTNFDIFATAGGENIAVIEQFTATANSSGQIVIVFTTVTDNAAVNGIEIEGSTSSGCGTDVLDINSSGPAVSGTAWVADEDFSGGTTSSFTATVSTTGVTCPAPAAVYLTQRYGNFTYTIPGLTPGANYEVRLHFSEGYWTAAGKRVFDVSINGTQVLTNFDIFATAGGENKAVVEQFEESANTSGQIVIVFTTVTDNAAVNGIQIQTAAPCTTAPSAPTGLTATATSSSSIALSWTAVTPPPNCAISSYSVYTSAGTLVASGVTGTTYTVTGLSPSTTYTYYVKAVDSDGTSPASATASATTPAGGGGTGNCSGVSNITVAGITYTPQWCQEFNGAVGSPDTTVWNFDLGNNGGWGNGEAEVYCGPPGYSGNPSGCPTTFSTATSNAYIDGNGHLVVQPLEVGGTWYSARMQTEGKQNFTYGIFEASLQLPNTTNQGLWPAFWTLGSDITTVPWPGCGEADIMENWSPQVDGGAGTTGNNSTIHTAKTGGSGIGARYTFPAGQATNTAFHTYGIIWTQNEMQFFVDNASAPFFTATPSILPSGDTWPFNQSIFTILNIAVGGTLGGSISGLSNPAGVMMVDYIRWYVPN